MKKLLPIFIILALVAVILCFAACGNGTVDDTITSMSNEMTTIMDNITSDISEAESNLFEDTTDLTDITDVSDITDNTLTTNNGTVTTE